jgi:hypothetical protein
LAYGNRTFQVWKCQGIGTATPSDKETQNTDAYFGEPVFRYSYYQGVKDGILAVTERYKFLTNIDLTGIYDMGFDFEPEDLGRRVDVPRRNELIAEKYFEVIGYEQTHIIPKTLVLAGVEEVITDDTVETTEIQEISETEGHSDGEEIISDKDEDKDKEPKETEKIEMVIADVPVYGAFRRL